MPQQRSNGEDSRLGVIILGASTFPHYPAEERRDNPSFGRSAEAFRGLFENSGTYIGGRAEVLNLFDDVDPPNRQLTRIEEFLSASKSIEDVVIYYCGHGDFYGPSEDYVLLLNASEPRREGYTALQPRLAKSHLDDQLAQRSVFLVLDCCYAAEALNQWQGTSFDRMIDKGVFEGFPRRGTALIAASARGQPAIAPKGEPLTMFTGALIDVIENGIKSRKNTLSFRDVLEGSRRRMNERWGREARTPSIHAPFQPEGDISDNPFFINRAFNDQSVAVVADRETFDAATLQLKSPLHRMRRAAVETLAELRASATSATLREQIATHLSDVSRSDDSQEVRNAAAVALGKKAESPKAAKTEPTPAPTLRRAAPTSVTRAAPAKEGQQRRKGLISEIVLSVLSIVIAAVLVLELSGSKVLPGIAAGLLASVGVPTSDRSWSAIGTAIGAAVTETRSELEVDGFTQHGAVLWSNQLDQGIVGVAKFPADNLTLFLSFKPGGEAGAAGALFDLFLTNDSGSSGRGYATARQPITELSAIIGMPSAGADRGFVLRGQPRTRAAEFGFRLASTQSNAKRNLEALVTYAWLEVHFTTTHGTAVLRLERNPGTLRIWDEFLTSDVAENAPVPEEPADTAPAPAVEDAPAAEMVTDAPADSAPVPATEEGPPAAEAAPSGLQISSDR